MSHPNRYIFLVSYPYEPDLFATTLQGLAAMCQRWLEATGKFPHPTVRPVIAGVRGTKAEHLARMLSCKQEILITAGDDLWQLLAKRALARAWSDAATITLFDEMILPAVFVETFERGAMLQMQFATGPLPQWWVEGPAGERPPVHTHGPVTFAIKRKLSAHFGVPAVDLITQIVDLSGRAFGPEPDQPTEGEFSVRIRFT
jgi:hypothetical protein